jgi:hypothetical protein
MCKKAKSQNSIFVRRIDRAEGLVCLDMTHDQCFEKGVGWLPDTGAGCDTMSVWDMGQFVGRSHIAGVVIQTRFWG